MSYLVFKILNAKISKKHEYLIKFGLLEEGDGLVNNVTKYNLESEQIKSENIGWSKFACDILSFVLFDLNIPFIYYCDTRKLIKSC